MYYNLFVNCGRMLDKRYENPQTGMDFERIYR